MANDFDGIVKWLRMQDADDLADDLVAIEKDSREAIRVLAMAGRAANVISKYAQRKYGTFVVTAADVDRCDKALKEIEQNKIAREAVDDAAKFVGGG